jgi:hypothetical protein
MMRAQTDQVGGVGGSVVFPVDDVMHFQKPVRTTSRYPAALIAQDHVAAGAFGDDPLTAADRPTTRHRQRRRLLMSRRSPFEVRLSVEDRVVLQEWASSRAAAHAEVVRARIMLVAADGEQNVDIARRVGVCVDVASMWRKRFCGEGLAGLRDCCRPGRPRRFGSEVVAVSEGPVESISSSTVRRWLRGAAIKPWCYRSWIFPRGSRLRREGGAGCWTSTGASSRASHSAPTTM